MDASGKVFIVHVINSFFLSSQCFIRLASTFDIPNIVVNRKHRI